MLRTVLACFVVFGLVSPSLATTGPGCLVVVNVASNDVLNMRARASASATIVDRLVPDRHGIIHLDGKCIPENSPWARSMVSGHALLREPDNARLGQGTVRARLGMPLTDERDGRCQGS
jgi:hypothetical protein